MKLNSNIEEVKKRIIGAYVEYRSLRGKKVRSKYLDNLQKRFKYYRKVLIRMLSKAPKKQVRSVGSPSKLKSSNIAIMLSCFVIMQKCITNMIGVKYGDVPKKIGKKLSQR